MKRALALALTLVLLVSCDVKTPAPKGGKIEPIEATGIVDLFPAERTAEREEGYADFAVKLLRANRKEGKNTLMSPLSVTLALGMTSAGAGGDTAQQFADLLGVDLGSLSAYCLALMEDYSDLGGSSETNLVNSLWCDPELALEDEFVITCREYFAAQLYHADLQSQDTVQSVNNWVSDATKGKIPTIVDKFDEDAVLALINAIYFKNQFETPFKTPTQKWQMDFHNADGTLTRPDGMGNGTRNETYLYHDKGSGVVLPYDDGKLGLLLMLPDEGVSLTDYLANWNGTTISHLLENKMDARVCLTVPKFKAEWSGSLNESLQAMGLTNAFDPDFADFTPMGAHSKGYPLYIGSVVHKTAFEVNEKGTEAAAVTAVIMEAASAMPPTDLIELDFDRPFVYGIVDLENGAPLFLGTIEQLPNG